MAIEIKSASPCQQQVREVLDVLGTDPHRGLREQEAHTRLEGFGRNEPAPAREVPEWTRFFTEFQGARVIQSASLRTAEAVLTRESLPVSKDSAPTTLSLNDWIWCTAVGSSVLSLREATKQVGQRTFAKRNYA